MIDIVVRDKFLSIPQLVILSEEYGNREVRFRHLPCNLTFVLMYKRGNEVCEEELEEEHGNWIWRPSSDFTEESGAVEVQLKGTAEGICWLSTPTKVTVRRSIRTEE